MTRYLPFLALITCSAFAAWLDMINVLTLVGYELASGPFMVGTAAIAMTLPHLLFSSVFANIAKRFSFTAVMAWTLVGRALCSLALVFVGDVYWLIVILLVRSFLFGFMQPALAKYVSTLPQQINIAALINLIVSSSKVIAPAIGGLFAVTTGEQGAFISSAILSLVALCVLVGCPVPTEAMQADPGNQRAALSTAGKPRAITNLFMLMVMMPVLFVDGLSNFFSNVIPYLFNEYELSKMTLSMALSVSAVGNILAGVWLVRTVAERAYPLRAMSYSWLAVSALFALLLFVLHRSVFTALTVPLVFFGLSFVKTFFDVQINGFIFQQTANVAVELAAARQQAAAFAGIVMTSCGTYAMEMGDSLQVLAFALGVSGIGWFVWYRYCRMRNQLMSLS